MRTPKYNVNDKVLIYEKHNSTIEAKIMQIRICIYEKGSFVVYNLIAGNKEYIRYEEDIVRAL